jgi:hypothetical protein
VLKALSIHNSATMNPFRLVIGVPLTAVGLGLTLVAVYLIANTADKLPYMVVWGLGLLTMMLGLKFLPKKKQRGESSVAGRSHGRPDDNQRDCPATKQQKVFARELGIEFPPSISKGDLSDLIAKERASER